MNRVVPATLASILFCAHASGATLGELINKNVEDAASAYDRALPSAQQPANLAQLWIHIRSDRQNNVAQQILDRVAQTRFRQWKVERKPVQKVDSGPRKSQLRYFKKQDQPQAQELFNVLRRLVPDLELSDASGRYDGVAWIRSGHYELWLSPDIMVLKPEH